MPNDFALVPDEIRLYRLYKFSFRNTGSFTKIVCESATYRSVREASFAVNRYFEAIRKSVNQGRYLRFFQIFDFWITRPPRVYGISVGSNLAHLFSALVAHYPEINSLLYAQVARRDGKTRLSEAIRSWVNWFEFHR